VALGSPRSLLNGRVSVDVVDLTDRVDAVVRPRLVPAKPALNF